jgi:hypothetical protein
MAGIGLQGNWAPELQATEAMAIATSKGGGRLDRVGDDDSVREVVCEWAIAGE